MVIRRIRDHVAAQNWFAVGIDLAIVVLGVLIATQVSIWNERRIEAEQAKSYRERLVDELEFNTRQFQTQTAYYRRGSDYGQQALAALSGKAPLADRDFLIAAYQLSQTDTTPAKSYIYDEMTANGMVTRIGDAKLQQQVSDYYLGLDASNRILAADYPYRTLIRTVMPYDVQKKIRDACGDRVVRFKDRLIGVQLVVPCPVMLDPAAAAAAVKTVRATPRLVEEMTRYLGSLDEKLDQLEPGGEYSKLLRNQLVRPAARHAP